VLVRVRRVLLTRAVRLVLKRMDDPVEFQRRQTEPVAQREAECRYCLAPCAVEPEPGVAATHEYIGLLGLAKTLGGDVVAHIGKTSPRAACHVFLPCRAAGSK
jgi:hypothetical protein